MDFLRYLISFFLLCFSCFWLLYWLHRIVMYLSNNKLFNVIPAEIEHLTMQYWTTSACCVSILIFFSLVIWRACESKRPPCWSSDWHGVFGFSCLVLYTVLCCMSLGVISRTGKYLSYTNLEFLLARTNVCWMA